MRQTHAELYQDIPAFAQANVGAVLADSALYSGLNNLGMVCMDRGNYAEAEAHYLRALDIWEKANGPDDSQVAIALKCMNNALVGGGPHPIRAFKNLRKAGSVWRLSIAASVAPHW